MFRYTRAGVFIAALLSSGALCSACSDGDASNTAEDEIRHGQRVTGYENVGRIAQRLHPPLQQVLSGHCTATLLEGGQCVLTARHCLYADALEFELDLPTGKKTVAAHTPAYHPTADIAVIRLAARVNEVPGAVITRTRTMPGAGLVAVGYGESGLPEPQTGEIKRRGEFVLDDYRQAVPVDNTRSTMLVLSDASGAGHALCKGDSGGPVFASDGTIVGVNSASRARIFAGSMTCVRDRQASDPNPPTLPSACYPAPPDAPDPGNGVFIGHHGGCFDQAKDLVWLDHQQYVDLRGYIANLYFANAVASDSFAVAKRFCELLNTPGVLRTDFGRFATTNRQALDQFERLAGGMTGWRMPRIDELQALSGRYDPQTGRGGHEYVFNMHQTDYEIAFWGSGGPDQDSDGIPDSLDNCPATWNPDQEDVCAGFPTEIAESTSLINVRTGEPFEYSGLGLCARTVGGFAASTFHELPWLDDTLARLCRDPILPPPAAPIPGSCGDRSCDISEDSLSCAKDCGRCGDGVCSGAERFGSCSDCSTYPWASASEPGCVRRVRQSARTSKPAVVITVRN